MWLIIQHHLKGCGFVSVLLFCFLCVVMAVAVVKAQYKSSWVEFLMEKKKSYQQLVTWKISMLYHWKLPDQFENITILNSTQTCAMHVCGVLLLYKIVVQHKEMALSNARWWDKNPSESDGCTLAPFCSCQAVRLSAESSFSILSTLHSPQPPFFPAKSGYIDCLSFARLKQRKGWEARTGSALSIVRRCFMLWKLQWRDKGQNEMRRLWRLFT